MVRGTHTLGAMGQQRGLGDTSKTFPRLINERMLVVDRLEKQGKLARFLKFEFGPPGPPDDPD